MRNTIILMTALSAALVLSATEAVAKDEVYRWVDENGIVHFGDQPDAQGRAEQIEVQTSQGVSGQPATPSGTAESGQNQDPGPSLAQQKRDERAEKRKEAALQKEAIAAGCEQRHQLVTQLEPSPRVMIEREDGTVERMDDNQRLEMLAEAKAYIAEKCDK